MFTNVHRSHFVTVKAKFRWKVTQKSFSKAAKWGCRRERAERASWGCSRLPPRRKTRGTRALCPVASCHEGVGTGVGVRPVRTQFFSLPLTVGWPRGLRVGPPEPTVMATVVGFATVVGHSVRFQPADGGCRVPDLCGQPPPRTLLRW
jgi:hypothetical protein